MDGRGAFAEALQETAVGEHDAVVLRVPLGCIGQVRRGAVVVLADQLEMGGGAHAQLHQLRLDGNLVRILRSGDRHGSSGRPVGQIEVDQGLARAAGRCRRAEIIEADDPGICHHGHRLPADVLSPEQPPLLHSELDATAHPAGPFLGCGNQPVAVEEPIHHQATEQEQKQGNKQGTLA